MQRLLHEETLPEETLPEESWWTRPAGGRELLRMALPLVVSTSSWTIMNFIDRAMLTHYSADSMAAAMPGSMMTFTLLCFFFGVASYVNTFVAQYHGAGHDERIGLAVWQANFVSFLVFPLALATIPLAPWAFGLAGHDPEVTKLEVLYYQVNTWGAGASVLASALSGFFTGRGQVNTVMMVDFFAASVNVVLDYFWIFGVAGFPEWGIAGAGWATVVALWVRAAIYMYLFLRPVERARYGTWSGFRWDSELSRRLWSYGSAGGMQMLLECSGFTAMVMLIGRLGKLEQTASGMAFNLNGLAFMPIYGFGIAASTMVGQRLGENQPELAARATWSSFWLSVVYTAGVMSLYLFLPDLLLAGYRFDGKDAVRLHELTTILLRYVAAYCLLDSINCIFASAIKGAGDTRFVLITTFFTSCIATATMLIGLLKFEDQLGLYFAWNVLTTWIFTLGIAYLARFVQGKWKQMRVIEEEFLRK